MSSWPESSAAASAKPSESKPMMRWRSGETPLGFGGGLDWTRASSTAVAAGRVRAGRVGVLWGLAA